MANPFQPYQDSIAPEHQALLLEYARDDSPGLSPPSILFQSRYQTARAKYDANLPWSEIIDDIPEFDYNEWLCNNYTRSSAEVWESVIDPGPQHSNAFSADGNRCTLGSSTGVPSFMQPPTIRLTPPSPQLAASAPTHGAWNGSTMLTPGGEGLAELRRALPSQESTMLTSRGQGMDDLRRALPSDVKPDGWKAKFERGQRILKATLDPTNEENARFLAEEYNARWKDLWDEVMG